MALLGDSGAVVFDDELTDQCDEIRAIAAKKWTKPSSVSLTRLDQVKAAIYNLGLTDPRDLKPSSVHERNRRNKQLSELETDPPLSTVSLQKNAWGSNSSIPDLIKQHSEASKTTTPTRRRPASAKTTTNTRPPSGRKNRPQSAKDFSQTSTDKQTPTIAVKGSKYDPNGRPPRGPTYGMAGGSGWVGPPAGLRLDPDVTPHNVAVESHTTIESEFGQYEFSTSGAPPAPCASPEPGEGTLDNFSDIDSIHCESHKSLLLRKPTPEPIHLSIPNAEEEEGEDLDELDTERLLREAESHTSQANGRASQLPKYNQKSGFSYTNAQTTHDRLTPRDDELSGRRSPSLYDINANTLPVSAPASANITRHASRLTTRSAGRSGVMFREDRNVTVDITPRNIGRKVTSLSAGAKRFMAKKKYPRADFSHIKSRVNSGIDASALLAERRTVNLDVSSPESDTLGLELNVRPVTRSQIQAPPPPPVPTVTVKYDETGSLKSSGSSQTAPEKEKKKIRKEIDLVTMVSQVSLTESEEFNDNDDPDEKSNVLSMNNSNTTINNSNTPQVRKNIRKFLQPPSNPKLYKSQTERNYYELAMRADRGKSPERNATEEKENVLYKTIKTIEFDSDRPVEKTERSVIPGSFMTTKPREKLSVAVDYLEQKRMSPRSSAISIKTTSPPMEPGEEDAEKTVETELKVPTAEQTASSTSLDMASLSPEDLEILAQAQAKSEEKFKAMFLIPPPAQRPQKQQQHRGRTAKGQRSKPSSASKREPTADENIIKIHTDSILSMNVNEDEDGTTMRPTSCLVSSERVLNTDTRRTQSAAVRGPRSSLKQYASYSQSKLSRKKENWDLDSVVYINTKKPSQDLETEEKLACQDMHQRMAELGCNIRPETLERALFPPSGKTLYYDLPTEQPMAPSDGLLSHPRFWLPKEYNKFKLAEKQLARAEHLLWLQRREEDRRTKSAMDLKAPGKKKKKKGKAKGKKGKPARSNSIC